MDINECEKMLLCLYKQMSSAKFLIESQMDNLVSQGITKELHLSLLNIIESSVRLLKYSKE